MERLDLVAMIEGRWLISRLGVEGYRCRCIRCVTWASTSPLATSRGSLYKLGIQNVVSTLEALEEARNCTDKKRTAEHSLLR